MSPLQKLRLWRQRRRREQDLREELQFHVDEETEERQASGVPADEARRTAQRDLGNELLLREDARALWTFTPVEQLGQDLRYALRTMSRNRAFSVLAALSLALGIGANTAIYSFMDAILLRALPVQDPDSLVVMKWRAKPYDSSSGRGTFPTSSSFVLRSIDGSVFNDPEGRTATIFPFPAFERLREASQPVLSTLFGYYKAGRVNVIVRGEAELATGEYVTGDFFAGLQVAPLAGRMIQSADDRAGAPAVAVVSSGYSERRFGGPAAAPGQQIVVNNVPFTVVGVTPSEFFGVNPAKLPDVYLPLQAMVLLDRDAAQQLVHPNYYWLEMMGRLRPGVTLQQAEAELGPAFARWVATTAENDAERANLPRLRLGEGAGGLDTLRRQYSKPLYVLLAMVGLILVIACANTANLLLARASARRREMAVRLSLGAGRLRIVRQLLTESVLLASLAGALGVLVAMAGMRLLTLLLANGQEGFTLHAELNRHVLGATLLLSLLCGLLFGLAPALQATRPALAPALKERAASAHAPAAGGRRRMAPALVVAQIALSLVMLVGAGLFVRTLSNLQEVSLGFDRENLLLFELNAPQAGHPEENVVQFYGELLDRFAEIPGVRDATLSHASLVRAGRSHGMAVEGQPAPPGTRVLYTGPSFFTTMRIPILRGREIDERDRQGGTRVAVVSEGFARSSFGAADPIGRRIRLLPKLPNPVDYEIVGVAGTVRYGGLKREIPPVVYVPYSQLGPPLRVREMVYALRSDGDPLRHAASVRRIVQEADGRVPVTNLKTQAADIDQTINQEIVFARLCSVFAGLALLIACVGLYGTMAYAVARRTAEIGIRMALGARSGIVISMVLREVLVLTGLGLVIGLPIALSGSRFLESLLFGMQPNDPRALAAAAAILVSAALVAGYVPARRASRVDPMTALRNE